MSLPCSWEADSAPERRWLTLPRWRQHLLSILAGGREGLGETRGSYHCDGTSPPRGARRPGGAAAGCCLGRQNVPCGASAWPPVVFQSLPGWPGCSGNQPSRARSLQPAACESPRIALGRGWARQKAFSANARGCCEQRFCSLFLCSRAGLCCLRNETVARAPADPGDAGAEPTAAPPTRPALAAVLIREERSF